MSINFKIAEHLTETANEVAANKVLFDHLLSFLFAKGIVDKSEYLKSVEACKELAIKEFKAENEEEVKVLEDIFNVHIENLKK